MRLLITLALAAAPLGLVAGSPQVSAPPNEPAEVRLDGDAIQIRYNGTLIFDGRVLNPAELRASRPGVSRRGDLVDQTVAFFARGRAPLEISGTIAASAQAFGAESDRPVRGRPIVRHSLGPSRSLRNQSVYDRQWDWVLSVDDQPRTAVRVTPEPERDRGRTFKLEARGSEIVLRFRPRFYQRHRGLPFFEPWTYDVWSKPIVGWCSWFAFFDKVTEQDVMRTADVMAEVLAPYGYDYLQIDDGYQRGTGLPELWLRTNEKFPNGLEALATYIKRKGLRPGIWTNAAFSQTDYAEAHKDLFVRDPSGEPAWGNWIQHVVDASAPNALETLVRPLYRTLRGMGWDYFKLDALRHLRYEGYNTFRDHFAAKNVEPADAFRRYVAAVREEVGRDRFLLACWGVRPELVGLVDGCRLGTDGFSYAGLAQFNSFNNVVWRNDPDHIELSDTEAWRSTMVTSLTGSLLLLTDKPERWRTPFAEPARRAAPVPVTTPGQLYDVDPSRSAELWRADTEVSGRDPKPFDAGLTPPAHLYLLEVNRPFESWAVLGRTGGEFDEIRFDELGLDPAKRYQVFEFWQKKYYGSFATSFGPGALRQPFNSQAFVIREIQDRPQLLATSRHITGGGIDLIDVTWRDGTLAGRSQAVAGDAYELYLTEPLGWEVVDLQCDGAVPMPVERLGVMIRTGCRTNAGGEIGWRARFERRPPDSLVGVPGAPPAPPPPAKPARPGRRAPEETFLLFTSFRGNGEDGLHLLWSADGYTWMPVRDDRSLLKPDVGGKLMRDPQIVRGPDGLFHMVWTTAWEKFGIGYASSKDLLTWSGQRYIDVMKGEPDTRNVWAPELFYDSAGREYLIFWSSTIPGRFPETARSEDDGHNHRIYVTTTKDFTGFTPARLFYDPGFNAIDATIVRDGQRYVMFIKDETRFPPMKNLHLATADVPVGPWGRPSPPITRDVWAEGPTAIQIGDTWFVYFDAYAEGRYGLVTSKDLVVWQDESAKLRMPKGHRHGSVFRVPRAILEGLIKEP
jgi:hypothetical protein